MILDIEYLFGRCQYVCAMNINNPQFFWQMCPKKEINGNKCP